MSIPPAFSSPCDLAKNIPAMVADFLDIETFVGRRFREESISDVIVASLLKLPGDNVVVITPCEARTGSDFDIIVVDDVMKDIIQYRIQAKRLTPHERQWKLGSYRELAHPNGTGKQASTLIRSSAHEAIPTIPLYAFYNPKSVCADSGGIISGIELADGRAINAMIKALVKAKPKRPPLKRIETLQPLFFPLTTLFCPPRVASRETLSTVPSPRDSRLAVTQAIADRGSLPTIFSDPMIGFDASSALRQITTEQRRNPDFEVPQRLPAIIRGAIQQRKAGILRAKVRRPRVVLISTPSSDPMHPRSEE